MKNDVVSQINVITGELVFHTNIDDFGCNFGVYEIDFNGNVLISNLNKTQTKIVEFIKNNSNITIEEMAKYAGVETRTIERNIKALKEKGIVDRIGADKNGHWVVKI